MAGNFWSWKVWYEQTCRKLTPVLLAAALLKAFVSLSCDSSLSLSGMWEQIPKMLMKMRMIVL